MSIVTIGIDLAKNVFAVHGAPLASSFNQARRFPNSHNINRLLALVGESI